MTIEEKASAYDKALKWMRELYPGLHGATKEDAEHYFPELCESEDERIRKEIVSALKFANVGGVYDKHIAYLEKKKDHFRDDTKMVEKQDYSSLNDLERAIHRGFLSAGVENAPVTLIKETAKECLEQMKPSEINVKALLAADRLASAEMTGRLKERNEILENPEKYNLCKPAEWSEKDKEMLERCIAAIPVKGDEIMPTYYLNKLKDWLLELPKRFNLQPKQEWSDEDEKMRNLAIEWAETMSGQFSFVDMDSTDFCKIATWLKSLRPSLIGSPEKSR